MKRLLATLSVTLAMTASGAPTQAQIPPVCQSVDCGEVAQYEQFLREVVEENADNTRVVASALAQIAMAEAYQAAGALPDEELEPEPPLQIPGARGSVDSSQGPLRGMFYYPWYPEDWGTCTAGDPSRSHYNPSFGCYGDDQATFDRHMAEIAGTGGDLAISSWYQFNPGTATPSVRDQRFDNILLAASRANIAVAPYYELEGFNDNDPNQTTPSWSAIRFQLNYIANNYITHPNYLRVDGQPVIFVFAESRDACGDGLNQDTAGEEEMVERWWNALRSSSRRQSIPIVAQFHVVFKVFDQIPGGGADYLNCPRYPKYHSFHQYGPSANDPQEHANTTAGFNETGVNGSFVISPGFWRFDQAAPPRASGTDNAERNLPEFRDHIRRMVTSGKFWQLITTYNEFIEGTQVESDTRFDNIYLEALANDGAEPAITGKVMGAGDIACDPDLTTDMPPGPTSPTDWNNGNGTATRCAQMRTSQLMIDQGATAVMTFGDTQYETGILNDFQASYDPSWGRRKAITHPSVGNHEYCADAEPTDPDCGSGEDNAEGYFDYFGASAGPRRPTVPAGEAEGAYSWNHAGWHFIALNSQCSEAGGCHTGSVQYTWLDRDLQNDPGRCEVAYWHHPPWSDGTDHNDMAAYQPFWDLLVDRGVDLVIVGHSHNYQRYPPMDKDGNTDRGFGVRYLVVGTGGRNLTGVASEVPQTDPNPEAWNAGNGTSPGGFDNAFGVIRLDLRPNDATFTFVPEAGSGNYTDTGTVTCLSEMVG